MDSQSIRTIGKSRLKNEGVEEIKGRKRHILVDIQGVLLAVHIREANLGDRRGLEKLLIKIESLYQGLKKYGLTGIFGYEDGSLIHAIP